MTPTRSLMMTIAALAMLPAATIAAPAGPIGLKIDRAYSPAGGQGSSSSLAYAPGAAEEVVLDLDGKRSVTNLANCPGLERPLTALGRSTGAGVAQSGDLRYTLTAGGRTRGFTAAQEAATAASAEQSLSIAAICQWPAIAPPAFAAARQVINGAESLPVAVIFERAENAPASAVPRTLVLYHNRGGFFLRLTEQLVGSAAPTTAWASSSTCLTLDSNADALVDLVADKADVASPPGLRYEVMFDPAFNLSPPGNWSSALGRWWKSASAALDNCWTAQPGRPRRE